jgi:hypothetical protein
VGPDECSIFNAFIAVYPNHIMIDCVVKLVMHNVNSKLYNDNKYDVTGPRVFGRAFNRFLNKHDDTRIVAGNFIHGMYKIKILYNEFNFIVDANGNNVIKLKIPNHYKLLYNDKNITYYPTLWNNRTIYN